MLLFCDEKATDTRSQTSSETSQRGEVATPTTLPWIHPEWIFLEQNQLNLARTDQKIVGQGV